MKAHETEGLVDAYDRASGLRFEEIPGEAQTVIASIQFQYGSIKKRQPKFWALVIVQDWRGAAQELGSFGQRYKSRRAKEQEKLRGIFREHPGTTHVSGVLVPVRS